MYIYSTSDRFTKIRQSNLFKVITFILAYIPGPGGIEFNSQKGSNPFMSPRGDGTYRQ